MTTHKIDIEGVPEGWEVESINFPLPGIKINEIHPDGVCNTVVTVKLQKTKPRRIVLEETGEDRDVMDDNELVTSEGLAIQVCGDKIWRIKEE